LFVTGGAELSSREGTTQGDPLAMSFYGLSTVPLQQKLRDIESEILQVWLADDATGAGKLRKLRRWWDAIIAIGAMYGYYVNEDKSWLILKDPEHLELAREIFSGTNIKITTAGKRHLGASLGSMEFRAEYASEKVDKWCREIERLSEFARSQPHAAYAAYIHGEQHRFRFFMRTIPGMEEYLKPLDDAINLRLIPALVGNDLNNEERALFSLPTRDGGMGIPILTEAAPTEFISSTTVNAPLAAIIALQETELPDENVVRDVVQEDRRRRAADSKNKTKRIINTLSASTLRAVTQAWEKGASNWLSSDHLMRMDSS